MYEIKSNKITFFARSCHSFCSLVITKWRISYCACNRFFGPFFWLYYCSFVYKIVDRKNIENKNTEITRLYVLQSNWLHQIFEEESCFVRFAFYLSLFIQSFVWQYMRREYESGTYYYSVKKIYIIMKWIYN